MRNCKYCKYYYSDECEKYEWYDTDFCMAEHEHSPEYTEYLKECTKNEKSS